MSEAGATPLFVDTDAFYARADSDDANHDVAIEVFEQIRTGALPYRPLYTSQAVISELATLLLYKLGHDHAARVLTSIRDSESFTVVPVDRSTFGVAAEQFTEYDDQQISFVDHTSCVIADERSVDHIFAFDGDFRTLGFSLVPEDVQVE